ncbi:MAG: iron chelate uptake ABC transporter family permease subunit [Coriobacteriales bacterium]|jgi:iron complex transport system permease protein|nr:iron chelate uptake ABC transporter family permease subunit [Coriobacteriales bacterium]
MIPRIHAKERECDKHEQKWAKTVGKIPSQQKNSLQANNKAVLQEDLPQKNIAVIQEDLLRNIMPVQQKFTSAANCITVQQRQRQRRRNIVCAALGAAVVLLSVLMLVLGQTIYSLEDIFRALCGEQIKGVSFAVQTLRLPRMLAGVLAGIAFGIAGSTFQSMLRNSLASPDIIGVTSGASAAAIFCMLVLKISGFQVSVAAVVFGLTVALVIYLLSDGGSFGGGRLIIIGIGIGAMLQAVISFILVRASQYDVPAAMRWLSGSLNGVKMVEIPVLVAAVFLLGGGIVLLSRRVKMFELGDEIAIALGVNVKQTRLLLTVAAVGLAAFATSVTGPIAFVAFLSGPIAARLTGDGRASALPSALVGAMLVLAADLIGQFAFDTRFPVGAITGILGAPYLVFLLVRQNKKGGAI